MLQCNKLRETKKRVSAFILAFLFLFSSMIWSGFSEPVEVFAVTQAEIDALEEKAKEISVAQAELKSQLSIISQDKSNAVARKALIEQEINLLNQEIANTEEQISLYEGLILRKVEEIQAAEAEERRQYQLFCDRVRIMEEAGDVSYWSILFSASDFSELLDRIIMIDEIMEYDNYIMDQLIAIRESIVREREELEVIKGEQEVIFLKQQEAKAEKVKQEKEVDLLIAEIAAQEAELKELQERLNAAAASMDEEIKKKEKELADKLAAQNAVIYSESGFMWPLPAYSTLSSLFGGRIDPITGGYGNHTGIDVPAPSGTPIQAAKSGIVLTSGYHSSYGNYVVLSHSNNQTTLYAHMVSRAVAEGATVSQGQTIGYVGTTGSSTGNHLHFEVRVNGVRYDPINYYPDKVFYMYSGGVTVRIN